MFLDRPAPNSKQHMTPFKPFQRFNLSSLGVSLLLPQWRGFSVMSDGRIWALLVLNNWMRHNGADLNRARETRRSVLAQSCLRESSCVKLFWWIDFWANFLLSCWQIYTDWANHYLAKSGHKRLIRDLQQDVSDGVLLAEIIQVIGERFTLSKTDIKSRSKIFCARCTQVVPLWYLH